MSDDAASLKAAIDAVPQGGADLDWGTNIVAGLEGAAAQFPTGQGDRAVPNVIIFITDGNDNSGGGDEDDGNTIADIAAASAATGADVYAIGVGNGVSQGTLNAIGPEGTFSADDFNDLIDLIEDIAGQRDNIEWKLPPATFIEPGDEVTLTFTTVTSLVPGTYCNEVQVIPGGADTRSGETAIVQIGPDPGLCPGEAVVVTKVWDSVILVSTDTTEVPYTYTFDVDYTITVDNIGTADLSIDEFIDLLPTGFFYVSTDGFGDIIDPPTLLDYVGVLDRERVTWEPVDGTVTMLAAIGPAIDELQDVVDNNPGPPLADKAEDAIEKLLNASLEYYKAPPDYVAAAGSLAGAAGDLQAAIDAGLFDPAQQAVDLMDYITGLARHLAATTLIQTILDDGDPDDIDAASLALWEGDVLRAAGAYKDAIAKYVTMLGILPFYIVGDFSEVAIGAGEVPSGTSKTLKFSTTTVVTRGNYWNDLLTDFGGGSFPENIYTWPTALVSVKDIFHVSATRVGSDVSVGDIGVWIGDEAGLIDFWGIR